MPKGAVPTDPGGRREAVNVPVTAVRAPDGDLHRAGIVPVREAVEHHRGMGGSYRHRDRLSGSGGARSGADETTGRAEDLRKEQTSPAPARGGAVGADGRQKRNDTDTADWARCRLTVTAAPTSQGFGGPFAVAVTFGAGSEPISSSQTWPDTVWHTWQVNARGGAI
jgi:hypothetical protein